MKKKWTARKGIIIFIACVLIVLIIIQIYHINHKYGMPPAQTYSRDEEVTFQDHYSIRVGDYEFLTADELDQKYPGGKAAISNPSTGEVDCDVLLIHAVLKVDDEKAQLGSANIILTSNSFGNGLAPDLFGAVNPEYDGLKKGENEVILAYTFPWVGIHNYNFNKIKKRHYNLVVSQNPVISIKLQ